MPDSDIRLLEVEPFFSFELPRARLKFGGTVADGVTFCHVRTRVQNRRGDIADGWGAILLSHFWAYRTPVVAVEVKDAIMRGAVTAFCQRFGEYNAYAHPIDIFVALEPELQPLAERVCFEAGVTDVMPLLGTLVCASPIDAAIHDAFGVVNGISTYDGYSHAFMGGDLSRFLGSAFHGADLTDFLRPSYAPSLPVFHVVGGLDKVRREDVEQGTADNGLPRSLEEWIEQDGVYCFKLKTRGNDMAWDVETTLAAYDLAARKLSERGRLELYLSLDPNEQCECPAYVIELLERVRERSAAAYDSILYVEQPVERDLARSRHDMRPLAALKPVLIDESLMTFEDLDLALELGWSGLALKTCKCQSLALLMAVRAHTENIPYAIQDLTNPGVALLQSVGLAARLYPIMGVETNARQYYPDLSIPESVVHGDITRVRDGHISTGSLKGSGLGYQRERVNRSIFSTAAARSTDT